MSLPTSLTPSVSVPVVGSQPDSSERPALLVSADPALVERLSGLAAAAGLVLDVTDALVDTAGHTLVLLGADVVATFAVGTGGPPAPQPRPTGADVVVVCPGEPPPDLWRQALAAGADHVVVLPDGEPWLLDRLVDAGSTPQHAVVVGVVGGRGGAGASTLATALAVTAARQGTQTILVDADPLGGGLDLVLGAEEDEGLRWRDLRSVRGRMQPGSLTRGLPCVDGVRLLSWGRGDDATSPESFTAVLDEAARGSDLVVLDLPRRFDDVSRVALEACATVFLVVPAEVRAAAAAGRVAAVLEAFVADIRLVVRGPAPTGLAAETIADSLALPLAGELRAEPGLAAALDHGIAPPLRPRGPLAVLCRRLTSQLLAA